MNKSQPDACPPESRAACDDFWLKASEPSLDAIWDNSEDDIYGEILKTLMLESGEKHEHI
jgi:hypothetical protein